MTTEELIKALREKPSRDNRKFLDEVADYVEMLQNAIFALNEEWTAQKVEIESLKIANEKMYDANKAQEAEIMEQASLILSLSSIKTTVINDAKAEAVKEFAERLKAHAYLHKPYGMSKVVDAHDIDNLVKEFTEGKTDEHPLP